MAMGLEEVEQLAVGVLSPFLDPARLAEQPAIIAALRPADADYALVFDARIAEATGRAYAALWKSPPRFDIVPGMRALIVAARAQDLATENPRSYQFPGGYRDIARLLLPDRVWLAWHFVAPGEVTGTSLDGLVHMGGTRFVWFPKPWRVITKPPPPLLSHYSE